MRCGVHSGDPEEMTSEDAPLSVHQGSGPELAIDLARIDPHTPAYRRRLRADRISPPDSRGVSLPFRPGIFSGACYFGEDCNAHNERDNRPAKGCWAVGILLNVLGHGEAPFGLLCLR